MLLLAPSCAKNGSDDAAVTTGAFVLNEGSAYKNNSNVGLYDPAAKQFSPDRFAAVNGKGLGDTGNHMLVLTDKVFIAVNISQVISVTDLDLKEIKNIKLNHEGTDLSPRYLAQGGGKVYVSCYEGYLAEIDPIDYSVRYTKVGRSPEGVAYADGKIYVANSGGADYPVFDKTVSVVDAASFKESLIIQVNLNPKFVVADKTQKMVYVSSIGDYGANPAKLEVIEVASGKCSAVAYDNVASISLGKDNKLYVMTGEYDASWKMQGKVFVHDAAANSKLGEFVKDGTALANAYSLSADPYSGNVYVGCSDYQNTGDMIVFDPQGRKYDSFDTGGLNPGGVFFK